jgi:hypothetical protein
MGITSIIIGVRTVAEALKRKRRCGGLSLHDRSAMVHLGGAAPPPQTP